MSYAVITPVRDEEEHIEAIVQAMAGQTILPERWIIVNDGSSDATGSIVESYSPKFEWISVLNRPNRGFRRNGGGVVEAFYAGYKQLQDVPWNFLVKLDGDVTFGSDYFESCLSEFESDVSLGIGGGAIYNVVGKECRFEAHPMFHVRGATKIYRRACWEQIGGIWPGSGWDTIDELKANRLGWTTRTFPGIHALHHRMTGAAEGGWRDNVKNGRGSYAAGYHPFYVLVRSVRRMHRKPYLLGSGAMLYGFVDAHLRRLPRIDDRALISYIQTQQMNRLFGRPSIWR